MSEDLIPRADMIRYLGVYMDANLNFKQHVTKKCKAAMLNYFKIKSIRPLLDVKTTARLCLRPMHIASGLLQLRVVWAARHNLKPIAKNPKHVCALNIKKRKKG